MTNYSSIFNEGKAVDLHDMLNAREQRFHIEQTLLKKSAGKGSLLVMTMAVPGPIKANNTLNKAFAEILTEVKSVLNAEQITKEFKREEDTGLEYFALSPLSPRELKPLVVTIEEEHPLGRLFDLDVVFLKEETDEVVGTSRTEFGLPVRRCFICDQPAKECGRSRRHSVEELQAEISKQILTYFND